MSDICFYVRVSCSVCVMRLDLQYLARDSIVIAVHCVWRCRLWRDHNKKITI